MRRVRVDLREEIRESLKRGNIVVIHPEASKKFRGTRVKAIDYPR